MRLLFSYLFVILSLYSCKGQSENDSLSASVPLANNPTMKIFRFDKEFYQYLSAPSVEKQKDLSFRYKDFLPAFGRITINNSDSNKDEFFDRLQRYFSNQMLSQIYKDALAVFDDVSAYEQELSVAIVLIKQKLPKREIPAFYMHISGFKENVVVLDGIISLSADKYLGMDYSGYKPFFENYQLLQMQPKMVNRDFLRAWLLSEQMLLSEKKRTLLSEMITEGKILYTLSELLPNWNNEDLIGYTAEQLKWSEDNEKAIWKFIVQQKHLYSSDFMTIQKYMNEAPYTTSLSMDSPGRIGAWVGWRIIQNYMSKNNVSLVDMVLTNSQQILKESGYNP